MWNCKLCHVIFAFESVEQHVYNNHVKPNVGSTKVYNCGECMFTAEGFEDIALHCINLGHEPTRVNKGSGYDEYASQLFTALAEMNMCLNKPSSALLDTSTSTNDPPERMTPIADGHNNAGAKIEWSEAVDGMDSSSANDDGSSNNNLLDGGSDPNNGETGEEGNVLYGVKIEPLDDQQPPTVQPPPRQTPAIPKTGNINKRTRSGSEGEASKRVRPAAEEKPFQWQTCGKSFGYAHMLVAHERTHSEEKPFVCPVCGNAFVRNDDLKEHERIHTGEKPFSCSVCGKAFTQNAALKEHERAHTGEKPFSCNVCAEFEWRQKKADAERKREERKNQSEDKKKAEAERKKERRKNQSEDEKKAESERRKEKRKNQSEDKKKAEAERRKEKRKNKSEDKKKAEAERKKEGRKNQSEDKKKARAKAETETREALARRDRREATTNDAPTQDYDDLSRLADRDPDHI